MHSILFRAIYLLLPFLFVQQLFAQEKYYTGGMGFTPWPYDLTEQAVEETYSFIAKNASIISHHFDGGVPWSAALRQTSLPTHLQNNWKGRKRQTAPHLKVFLSLTPLNFARDGLATHWNETGDNQPLPKEWKHKKLNDRDVIKAYTYYVLQAISHFDPDYLAIGIESNILISKNPSLWPAYLELHESVYAVVKKKYPRLPVFATVQYEHFRGIEGDSKENAPLQKPAVEKLLRSSDLLALSTYKYGFVHPNKITKNYFQPALEFNKQIAIAEMGAMSSTTLVMGMPLIASQANQKEFLHMILDGAIEHEFPFVINWVSIDFNAMLPKLPSAMRGIAKAWVHTGLVDKKKKPKKAFALWKKHLKNKR